MEFYLTLILSLLAYTGTAYKYFDTKKQEQDIQEFNRYHETLKWIVGEIDETQRNDKPFLDRQMAAIYELRHYKRYYDVSLRILKRSKTNAGWQEFPALMQEIDLAIDFIEQHKRA